MHICSPQLGLSPQSVLGGEVYDREVLKALAKLGVEVDILLPKNKPVEHIKNWNIYYLPFQHIVPPHFFNALIPYYLDLMYKRRPFNILRVHSPTFGGLGCLVFQQFHPNVPLIGVYHFIGEGGQVEKIVNPILIPHFSAIITDSEYTQKKISSTFNYPKNRIFTIYNGTDSNLKKKPRSKKLIEKYDLQKKFVLLFMGLFIPRKNPLFILEVMEKLLKETKDVVLFLCGDGPLEKTIKKNIIKKNLASYIHLLNPVFGEAKNDLMSIIDILVHPSMEEGFSLSVVETQSLGIPAIISDAHSAREAIEDGINGFVVPLNNVNLWAKKINLLQTKKNLLQKLKKEATTRAHQKFSWKDAAIKTYEVFKLVDELGDFDLKKAKR